MGWLDSLPLGKRLFAKLTLDEKRQALELDDFYLQSILDARQGKARVMEVGTDTGFVKKMTDADLRQAIEIVRLQKRAKTAGDTGRHREAIDLYEQIVRKVPFDSIALMSLGVQYAYLREGRKAVHYLEKALKADPGNGRIRGNLEAVRDDFGL